ncbi:MAG: sulfurtransferase complex subunit TusD [Halioglobus sp.]
MIYSLLVLASPTAGQTNRTAAGFAAELYSRGHTLHRVFFMDAGVDTALATPVAPQDEINPQALWIALAKQFDVELVACISSALKRGVLDELEATRYEKVAATLHPNFELGGLGQLVDASAHSDRLITFGGG